MKIRKPISAIKTENYTYFNLHAEEVFSSNYSCDEGPGIYISELNLNTFDIITTFVNNNPQINVVILDFNGLTKLQPNLVDKIIHLKKQKY